ncbi:MAG TPA: hypothetical protein VN521_00270 [Negativicutes bacterium]|nr:hypothetical protein [Negativicutes bacterium]
MTSDTKDGFAVAMEKLKACGDDIWGRYILTKDPLYGKIPTDARQGIIAGAFACARERFEDLAYRYGRMPATGYAARLGVMVETEAMRTEYEYVFISCYTAKPPTIKISATALDMLGELAAREKLTALLPREGLVELAIAHELFHHLEETKPGIYTRQKTVEYRALGFIRNRFCPVSAGEIAAVHFSRLVTGLDYSPAVYEVLLLAAQKRTLADRTVAALLAAARETG